MFGSRGCCDIVFEWMSIQISKFMFPAKGHVSLFFAELKWLFVLLADNTITKRPKLSVHNLVSATEDLASEFRQFEIEDGTDVLITQSGSYQ